MVFKDIDGFRTMEFGTPGEFREKLTSLVIHGHKRATAGLLSEYVLENEEIEHVGEELVLLGNNDVNLGKITEVSICKFKDVPDRFPIAEAEGDQNADVIFKRAEGDLTRKRSTILSQSVHHATEHRAQVVAALEFAGYKSINLDDYDLWSYEHLNG